MSSRDQAAVDAIVARLRKIRTEDGFSTSAGRNVYQGPYAVDPDNCPAIVIIESDETPDTMNAGSSPYTKVTLKLTVAGLIKACAEERGAELRALKADIKRAVMVSEYANEGFVRAANRGMPAKLGDSIGPAIYTGSTHAPRADGQQFESVVVSFEVTYTEKYGDPSQPAS